MTPSKFIAGQQVGLDEHRPALPFWVKRLLLWVYDRYGWAAVEGIQFRGSFDIEADARWAANCKGGWYREVPHNDPLPPDIACKFGIYDHPQSEFSADYRHRELAFTAVSRSQMKRLNKSLARSR